MQYLEPVKSPIRHTQLLIASVLATALVTLFAGCGGSTTPTPTPPPPNNPGVTFTGTVAAGTQPLIGATVQLYAAGTTGNGSAGTAMLTAALTTDTNGAFTVPANYPCPAAASQLYVVARGGKLGTAAANSAIALITSIGACNQVVASTQIVVNEVTTAATIWALSQFLLPAETSAPPPPTPSASPTPSATAASLANPLTGPRPAPPSPPTEPHPPQKSTPSPTSSTPAPRLPRLQRRLRQPALIHHRPRPCSNQDILDAALRIVTESRRQRRRALHPVHQPACRLHPRSHRRPRRLDPLRHLHRRRHELPRRPRHRRHRQRLGLQLLLASSTDPLADSAAELSPIGKPLFPSGITGSGLSNIYGLAVDASNNAWIPNEASPGTSTAASAASPSSTPAASPSPATTGYTAGGLYYPIAVAIDTDASAWVVDYGNSHLTHLSSSGAAPLRNLRLHLRLLRLPRRHRRRRQPQRLGRQPGRRLRHQSLLRRPDHSPTSPAATALRPRHRPAGNVWITNYYGNSVSQISSTGTVLSNGPSPPTAASTTPRASPSTAPATSGSPTTTPATSPSSPAPPPPPPPRPALSPATGWAPDANLFEAFAIAIDPSGNLWVTNFYGASSPNSSASPSP